MSAPSEARPRAHPWRNPEHLEERARHAAAELLGIADDLDGGNHAVDSLIARRLRSIAFDLDPTSVSQ